MCIAKGRSSVLPSHMLQTIRNWNWLPTIHIINYIGEIYRLCLSICPWARRGVKVLQSSYVIFNKEKHYLYSPIILAASIQHAGWSNYFTYFYHLSMEDQLAMLQVKAFDLSLKISSLMLTGAYKGLMMCIMMIRRFILANKDYLEFWTQFVAINRTYDK